MPITNNGERNMYCIKGDHECNISKETFDRVQAERKKRSNKNPDGSRKGTRFKSSKG